MLPSAKKTLIRIVPLAVALWPASGVNDWRFAKKRFPKPDF